MTSDQFQYLANYNSERCRGIVHTEEWKAYMAKLQNEFDIEMKTDPLGRHSWHDEPWRRPWYERIFG